MWRACATDRAQRLTTATLKDSLRCANEEAIAQGVYGVPTFDTGQRLWWGDDLLSAAAAECAQVSRPVPAEPDASAES